jgi:hypothetical protein
MSITDEEHEEFAEQFRQEVKTEHERRLAALDEPKKKRSSAENELQREAALAALRQEVRTAFYLEKGYVPYTDSRGLTNLVPPEELERRQSRQRRSKRRPKYLAKVQNYPYFGYVIVLLLGMALGYKIVY